MRILGISAFYHDSAAALVVDGEIIAAAHEERFSRLKQDSGFPVDACKYCLAEGGVSLDDIDYVVFYDKPLLKFERLLETYYAFSPKGLRSFLQAIPVWLKEKLFIKKIIRDGLKEVGEHDSKKVKFLFPEHHLSHAASAFYPSPFEEAAILTIDGVGEWSTASVCKGRGNEMEILKEMHFPHSVGLLYSSFTYFLGFKVNSGEYKLMGLAPYGDEGKISGYIEIIKQELLKIYPDGSLWLNPKYFAYPTSLRMVKDSVWEKLFGIKKRKKESEFLAEHANLALACQRVTEEIVMKMAVHAKEITGMENLCLAGGVALNCVANGKLIDSGVFKNVWIQPAAGDAGGALGAALAAYYIHLENDRKVNSGDSMKGSLLGPSFSKEQISDFLDSSELPDGKFQVSELPDKTLYQAVAHSISDGKVIGWFQGRMEYGPRALGCRSILGDPRNEDMQRRINMKIKYRESFRPFAPIVLEEDAHLFFDLEGRSPYMLQVHPVKMERRMDLPDNFSSLPLMEKLKLKRSDVPAITHVDFSARIQTVDGKSNPRLQKLLRAFKEVTGVGMLVNTSFNVRGEPIVCTPADALNCFKNTEMDILVLGNYIIEKK